MLARIGVRVLLISSDIQTIDTLCDQLERMTIHVEVCSDATTATRKLCHSKFEGIIVDFKDQQEAWDLVKKPRQLTSHKAAIIVAMLANETDMPSAFRAGASFVLVRPLTATVLSRTLRAAYPFMVRENRRSFRCPLQVPICLIDASGREIRATSDNISEGGIAVTGVPLLRVGDRIAVRLVLPGTEATTRLDAEVCWSDNGGRVGLEFLRVSFSVKEPLIVWLTNRLDELLLAQGRA